jgi:uncharacterized protein (PEP-CTERM system associated)
LGANTSGTTLNGSFNYRTRATNWTASYYTTTTTIQQLLTNSATFATQYDANGNPISNATAIERSISSPDLTNGIIISKRGQASMTWTLSKSNLSLGVYHNNISYSSGNSRPQDILGFTASWQWHFSPHVSAFVQGNWQTSEYQGSSSVASGNGKSEYRNTIFSVNRQLSSFVTGSLQYVYTQNNSSGSNIGIGGNGTYDANRVMADLYVTF